MSMGADIRGSWYNINKINGVEELKGSEYQIIQIELKLVLICVWPQQWVKRSFYII